MDVVTDLAVSVSAEDEVMEVDTEVDPVENIPTIKVGRIA